MKKALIFMAEGFEEIEALTVVDILRRADIKVDMCSITEKKMVTGAHGVQVMTDVMLYDVQNPQEYDAVITPGGLTGSTNLRDDEMVVEFIKGFYDKPDKLIASICASPIVLAKAGIASQIAGTCYPDCEQEVGYREYEEAPVFMDKNVITSRGPATSLYFALHIVEQLIGKEVAENLKEGTMLSFVEKYHR